MDAIPPTVQLSFKHRPGKLHNNADTMSRIPSAQQSILPVLYQITNHDAIKTAQRGNPSLSGIIQDLGHGQPIPSNVTPGLRHAFLRMAFCVECTGIHHHLLGTPRLLVFNILYCSNFTISQAILEYTRHWRKLRSATTGLVTNLMSLLGSENVSIASNVNQHAPLGTITSDYPFEKLSWDIMGPLPLSSAEN